MLGNTWLKPEAQLELALEQAVRWHRTAALLSSKGIAVCGVSKDTASENNDCGYKVARMPSILNMTAKPEARSGHADAVMQWWRTPITL